MKGSGGAAQIVRTRGAGWRLLEMRIEEMKRRQAKLEAREEQMRFYQWCGENSHSIGETLDRLAHHGFRNYKTLRFYVKRFFAVFYRRLPQRAEVSR